jgi:hypothetical protein
MFPAQLFLNAGLGNQLEYCVRVKNKDNKSYTESIVGTKDSVSSQLKYPVLAGRIIRLP